MYNFKAKINSNIKIKTLFQNWKINMRGNKKLKAWLWILALQVKK